VILSQVVRGAAEELSSRPGELIDPVLVSAALARAADAAYSSVRDPAEGTMITVVREMASRVATGIARMEKQRLAHDATDEEQDELLAQVLEQALEAAEASVERSPDLLPLLREHGVVDAGGYGVSLLIAGLIAGLRGEHADAPDVRHHAVPAPLHGPQHGASKYRYCTNFIVTGEAMEGPSFVPRLESIGDSVLVVGDKRTLRVHLHTDEPERAVAMFDRTGAVERLDVADMRDQEELRAARLLGNGAAAARPKLVTSGVVAVAAGSGMRALYEELGAHVVEGGATLNPSTFEILAGIHEVPAEQVIVLPNSPNVTMAAERAAELSEKTVEVVETSWPQQGLCCVVEYAPGAPVELNAQRMREALAGVRTGAVAPAARDDRKGRFKAGEAVGFVDGEIVAWGEPQTALAAVLERVADGSELLSCFAGEAAPLDRQAVARLVPGDVELESHEGGQPHYWWLIAAE
jgi:DAK2 domain fusion protein YloV